MILFTPKKLKYKKYQKRMVCKIKGEVPETQLIYGNFGLKALENFLMTPEQIESCRRVIKKHLTNRNQGFVKMNIFTTFPLTAKPLAVRMGKGKGNIAKWVCPVKAGRILFELRNIKSTLGQRVCLAVKAKIPVKTRIINI
jgi:large subunit ribosomal protein L16